MAKRKTKHSIRVRLPRQRKQFHASKNAYKLLLNDSFRYGCQTQRGGFLSRYDLSYVGRDTVNQAAKHLKTLAPELVNQTMNKAKTLAPELVDTASQELDMVAA